MLNTHIRIIEKVRQVQKFTMLNLEISFN
jgi:hypothetical protein